MAKTRINNIGAPLLKKGKLTTISAPSALSQITTKCLYRCWLRVNRIPMRVETDAADERLQALHILRAALALGRASHLETTMTYS